MREFNQCWDADNIDEALLDVFERYGLPVHVFDELWPKTAVWRNQYSGKKAWKKFVQLYRQGRSPVILFRVEHLGACTLVPWETLVTESGRTYICLVAGEPTNVVGVVRPVRYFVEEYSLWLGKPQNQ